MKPFSLEEYIKNPSRKIVTRDGKPVKILCTNLVSDKPVTAQIDGTGYSLSYTKDGKSSLTSRILMGHMSSTRVQGESMKEKSPL